MIYGWKRYLGFEQDFLNAEFYVSLQVDEAYSEFFTREVILLGAEIEASFKELCKAINGNDAGNIREYKESILSEYPAISDVYVKSLRNNLKSYPFKDWKSGQLEWWDVYTNVKHNLIDKKATLSSALTMLQAYELLLFFVSGTSGNFSIDYLDSPKLYLPEFEHGISVKNDMYFQLTYNGTEIQNRLKGKFI